MIEIPQKKNIKSVVKNLFVWADDLVKDISGIPKRYNKKESEKETFKVIETQIIFFNKVWERKRVNVM